MWKRVGGTSVWKGCPQLLPRWHHIQPHIGHTHSTLGQGLAPFRIFYFLKVDNL
jgi:hypothetical protein